MRKLLVVSVIVFLMTYVPLVKCQDNSTGELFSPEQLDNLLAPIALYPDPLLAQVLLAATFPDQIDEAARFLRANADPGYIDSQPWDVSVKAVAHYPTVLYMMADKLDWTTALGQAYVNQSADVTTSVQGLRAQARSAGNLMTTPQEEVVETGGYIDIWPAQPEFIYVPMYDPEMVYFRRPGFFGGSLISFGDGFAIGAWLNYDFDWGGHRVFYHGWQDGGGWVGRSRPYVRLTNAYVNSGYRNVAMDRTVVGRAVNYSGLNRYNGAHRAVNFNNIRANNRVINNPPVVVNNKIIQRNINTNDPRIGAYRGYAPQQQINRPEANRPQMNQPMSQTPPRQLERTQMNQPTSQAAPRQFERPQMNQPMSQAAPRQLERPESPAFGGNRGAFDPRAASQRGQDSRTARSQPEPATRPSSAPAPSGSGRSQPESRGNDRRRP